MKFVSHSVPFERSPWEIVTTTTSVSSLHMLYIQLREIACVGIETEPDGGVDAAVHSILLAVETRMRTGGFEGDYGILPAEIGKFNALGHLSGELRRFGRGLSDEPLDRVIHVFPCFQCELAPFWPAAQFVSVVRGVRDIFSLTREPSPFVEIMMEARAFTTPVARWAAIPLASVLSYVPALASDPSGVLKIRNLRGEVLVLNRATGWASYKDAIAAHAIMA